MFLLIVFEVVIAVAYAGITTLTNAQYRFRAFSWATFRKQLRYALFIVLVLIIIEVLAVFHHG